MVGIAKAIHFPFADRTGLSNAVPESARRTAAAAGSPAKSSNHRRSCEARPRLTDLPRLSHLNNPD